MGKINTVIFDIGNVLVDFCWEEAIDAMGLDEDTKKRLIAATIKSKTWDEFDRGILTEEEIHNCFIESDPQIRNAIDDFWNNYYSKIVKKFDYAKDWICSLKEHGYRVLFLSNFSEMGFRELADELDFVDLGDGAVISYREKVIKPDPEIYRILIDRYNINPSEAVFMDDTAVNIEAAAKFGLNTIHFVNRQQALCELAAMGVE